VGNFEYLDVEKLLEAYKRMYLSAPGANVKHQMVIGTENGIIQIQPSVSTGWNSFIMKDASEEDIKKAKRFAEDHHVPIFEAPIYDLD